MTQPLPGGVPGQFKHYRLTRQLGQGAMGSVFEGIDERVNERVAVKLLHPHLAASDPSFAERFEREAHTAALLRSPYTVHLLDFGEQHGRYFMVMEYIDGRSLGDTLRQDGPLEPARALWVAGEVARALEEAGARGIVHRDIKPDNILFDASGRVKVADFGIARSVQSSGLTMSGSFVGTPAYAAPEQAQGAADQRSDIYAVGIMLFTMLTGEPPFQGRTPVETMMLHATADLPMLRLGSAPLPAQNVIRRACEKDPLDRYQNAGELAGAIDRARQALLRQSDGGSGAGLGARPATPPTTSAPGASGSAPRGLPSIEPPTAVASRGSGAQAAPPAAASYGSGARTPTPPAAASYGSGARTPAPPAPAVPAAAPEPPRAAMAGSGPNRMLIAAGAGVVAAIAVGAGLFFALAGGGGGDGGGAGASPSPTTATGSPAEFALTAVEFQFDRATLTAPPNSKVTFTLTNEGQARHSLQFKTREGGTELAAGSTGQVIGGGESAQVTFTTPGPGAYWFECVNHPSRMNGVFEVREGAAGSPSPSPAAATATASPTATRAAATDTPLASVTAPAAAAKLSSGAKARPIAAVNLLDAPSGSAKVIRALSASDRLIVVTNTPASSTFVITEGLVFWRVLLEGTQTVGWAPEVTVDGSTRFLERVEP